MNQEDFRSVRKESSVYRVEPAKGVAGWRRKWCRVHRQFLVKTGK